MNVHSTLHRELIIKSESGWVSWSVSNPGLVLFGLDETDARIKVCSEGLKYSATYKMYTVGVPDTEATPAGSNVKAPCWVLEAPGALNYSSQSPSF